MPAPLPRYLISACLCGVCCRYDGSASGSERFAHLAANGLALPVCPELLGGLPVPRPPCELRGGRIFTRDGEDRTTAFLHGARQTLELALSHRVWYAIFKERSPSCGCAMVFDGSFTGLLVPGQGVTTALLRHNGITVMSEETAPEHL